MFARFCLQWIVALEGVNGDVRDLEMSAWKMPFACEIKNNIFLIVFFKKWSKYAITF